MVAAAAAGPADRIMLPKRIDAHRRKKAGHLHMVFLPILFSLLSSSFRNGRRQWVSFKRMHVDPIDSGLVSQAFVQGGAVVHDIE